MATVLMCALSATGGARSVVSIVETLVRRGHTVIVMSGPAAEPIYRQLPVRFVPVAEPPAIAASTGPAPRGRRAEAFAHIRRRYVDPMPDQWEALERVIRTDRVDVVLAEGLFLGAMALAYLPPEQRPYVIALGTFPPIFPDPAVPPYGLGAVPWGHAPGRAITAALEFVNSRAYAAAGVAFQDHVENFIGIRPHPDVRRAAMQPDVYAQLTVGRFEYDRRALPPNFRFVGPLRAGVAEHIPTWWDPRTEPPVVAVQFEDGDELDDLVLPAVRAFLGDSVVVLVAGADRQMVEHAYGRPLPPNVHFECSVPWSRLLSRRSVLVTSGHYVTVQHALTAGIPLVTAAAISSAQLETAARIKWAGSGINLRTRRPDPITLRNAVRLAQTDPEIQGAAARIAAQIALSDAEQTLAEIVGQAPAAGPLPYSLERTA